MGFIGVAPIKPEFDGTVRGSGAAKTREVSELSAVMSARQGAALQRGGSQTHKPHEKIVVRVKLDVAHMGLIGVAPIQPEFDATARGSGASKTREVSELSAVMPARQGAALRRHGSQEATRGHARVGPYGQQQREDGTPALGVERGRDFMGDGAEFGRRPGTAPISPLKSRLSINQSGLSHFICV
jgi:hypothetical protein